MAVKAYGRSVYRRPKKSRLRDMIPTQMPKRTGGRGRLPGFGGGAPRKAGGTRSGYQPGQVANPGAAIRKPHVDRYGAGGGFRGDQQTIVRDVPIGGLGGRRRRKRPRTTTDTIRRRYF
jgi:hypothetical protein